MFTPSTHGEECVEQSKVPKPDNSSAYYQNIYSQIEEVGWQHLVTLGADLTFLSFRILDEKGRVHVLEIQLDKSYPKKPPFISADVPYIFNLEWSIKSRLRDVVQQFEKHLEELQGFWSVMDEIDKSLSVSDSKQTSRATSYRLINMGNGCSVMLSINVKDPTSVPEFRFLGSSTEVESLRKIWQRRSRGWSKDKSFLENLEFVFGTELPIMLLDVLENEPQVECGICYAQYLPIDDELGARSGSGPDYICDNINCHHSFHSLCLGDWLRSITTTRQSFNCLFGKCPYCSEPVAVKINISKK